MIKVFGTTDKTFSSNGDVVLKPLKAKVHKQDNGDFYLDLETGLEYVDYLVEDNIIIANTPQGDQAFRITNPQKTRSRITVKAWHVFYDAKNYLIADSYVENKNCQQALTHLNNATEPQSEFTVSSDVTSVNSYRCVRTSLHDAVMTVLERWGGHLVRDNFSIQIKNSISHDNGITVQYKKNLREITVEENWDDVVTKILPVGKDGTLLNAVNPSASIYITSSTQYDLPYTKAVTFEQDINEEDYQTEAQYKSALVTDLRSQATAYMAENCVPKVNYTLKANLEKVTDIGDIIHVKDERLNINLLTSVIAYEYDCLLNKFTEIEFGNFKPTLSGLIPTISSSVNKTVTTNVNAELADKQNLLISGTNIKTINNQDILGSGDLEIPVPDKTSDLVNDSGFISADDNGNVSISGGLTVEGHSSKIGSRIIAKLDSQKNIATSTYVQVCKIDLPAGVWILTAYVRISANASGLRRANLALSSQADASTVQVAPASGGFTQLNFARVYAVSSNTSVYLNAWQNSGSELTLPAGDANGYVNGIVAVRIA